MKFFIGKMLSGALVLFGVSIVCFFLIASAPGSFLSSVVPNFWELSHKEKLAISQKYGLNLPIYVQYKNWLGNVISGNMGKSYVDGMPVSEKICEYLPYTLSLTAAALFLTVLISVPLGLISGNPRASPLARALSLFFYTVSASPNFWLGLLLIYFFAVVNRWLPTSGTVDVRLMLINGGTSPLYDRLAHLVLPAVTLAIGDGMVNEIIRHIRVEVTEIMREDYIRTARAKGVRKHAVFYKHALKNAMIPIITLVFHRIPYLLGGAVVVEKIFAWPGMGRLAINSIISRDYPVVMGVTIAAAVLVVLSGLLGDFLLALADPRITSSK